MSEETKEATLELISIVLARSVSEDLIYPRGYVNHNTQSGRADVISDQKTLGVKGYDYALHGENKYEVSWPRNWWEHFKQDHMPAWYKRWWPVLMSKKKWTLQAIFPDFKEEMPLNTGKLRRVVLIANGSEPLGMMVPRPTKRQVLEIERQLATAETAYAHILFRIWLDQLFSEEGLPD